MRATGGIRIPVSIPAPARRRRGRPARSSSWFTRCWGITPLAPAGTLIVDPAQPDWLPEVTLEGIRVGPARVDLRFRLDASGGTDHEILALSGDLTVRRREAAD